MTEDEEEKIEMQEEEAICFDMYMDDMTNVRKLTEEEIMECIKRDDAISRNMLIEHYLTRVVDWVKPYTKKGLAYGDLIQEGNIGLIQAITDINRELNDDDMMDKLKKNMVFYLLLLIDFYIVPWFIKNTGSAMIVMLVIIPLICLITSVFYGIRNGFNFWYILIVAIMFAPSIFIFYNSSAWVYVVGYAVIALLGNLIALPLGKR